MHKLFEDNQIDVLITNSQAYAPAGLPAITVPSGYASDGQPTDVLMVADYLGEPKIISAAHAFEQATHAQVEPDLEKTSQQIENLGNQ